MIQLWNYDDNCDIMICIVAMTGHSNTKYNIKYIILLAVAVWETLYRFAKVNHDLTTQISIIITDLLTLNFAYNVQEYFKDDRPKLTCQSQNALCGIHSDI